LRLSTDQVEKIHFTLNHFFGLIKFEIFVYGSRTDDSLKGGDIDLLILTNQNGLDLFANKKLDILVNLKKHPKIGQRKIDLKAATKEQLTYDPFLISIQPTLKKI
jgi:hypothetical protein